MNKDTIYRQAAIALAKDICVPIKDGTVYKHRCIDPDAIRDLPSAEPETCAYWDRESNICALHRPSAQQRHHTKENKMTELEARARWICCPMCDRKTCCFGASDCDAKRWMIERGEETERGQDDHTG